MEFIIEYWIGAVFGILITAVKLQSTKGKALQLGVQALLRDRIIQAYNHYKEKGYCPIYGRENIEGLYKQYHALGGNGTITDMMEDLRELPYTKGE